MNINTITQEVLDNLSLEERNEVLKILEEIKSDGHSASLDKLYEQDYDEVPVDIDTFIESDDYIGKFSNNGQLIYPYWREQLRRMFDPNDTYQEIALTGSIGIGKSTIACIAMAYLLYRTMCLKNPQEYYRLAAGSTIVFAFFNNTLDLTTSVGYGTIQNICQNSPWFLARGTVSGLKYKEYIPNKLIRFRIGSQAGHALGTNIISAMIDEVNFKVGANVRMEQSKIMETYNGVLERMGSRFMVNGKIAGKLFIVSSKKSEYDFLESYIRKKQDDPTVMVCDAKLWEVKPMGTYSGKTFKVAVGGSNLPSRILNDDEDVDSIIKQGYDVIYPPLEFKGRFEMDIQAALMNIAGISISHVTKFISYANLVKCYNTSKNPFTNNILTIGMSDSLKIQDFFIPELVPYEIYSMPLFVHLDTSLTGDKTGIGCVAAMGYKYYNEYSLDEGEVVPTKKLVYRHVFSVGIQCPQGTEISFQKTRDFIYYLKYTLGWNIRGISTDGFQSADTRQQLLTMGFDDVSLVSLDKTPNGYLTYKAAINEKRISMINIPELETETIRLERDNMSGKVDHPVDGSKDISDGLAGALYNASMHESEFTFHLTEDAGTIMDANSGSNVQNDREDLLNKLVASTVSNAMKDRNIIDVIPETSPSKDTDISDKINNIQNNNPGMSLGDAMKEYIKEQHSSQPSDPNDPDEIKKRFMAAKARQSSNSSDINDRIQDMMDDKDGIILF